MLAADDLWWLTVFVASPSCSVSSHTGVSAMSSSNQIAVGAADPADKKQATTTSSAPTGSVVNTGTMVFGSVEHTGVPLEMNGLLGPMGHQSTCIVHPLRALCPTTDTTAVIVPLPQCPSG